MTDYQDSITAPGQVQLGMGQLEELADDEEVYEYERYGDNVDETTLMYCGGCCCCWTGYDCRPHFIDNLKMSAEMKCVRIHCSCKQDVVKNVSTCCTCQERLCCLTNSMAMPPNSVGPCNCGKQSDFGKQ